MSDLKFYDRYYANNYEKLITYYPRFYRDVFEMVEILKAHGRIADGLEDNIELAFFNCFIDEMNEEAVYTLEAFLGISLDKSRTLEERRRLLKSYFAGFGKVSASMLEELISAYTGAEVECAFEPFDEDGNNRLYINFLRGDENTLYMSDIITLLSKKIPAHIQWQAAVVYRYGIGVEQKRAYYKYKYRPTGVFPQTVLLADINAVESVAESNIVDVKMDYKFAVDGASNTGRHPNTATIAHSDVISAATEPMAAEASVSYPPCGVLYSGQGG